jgi:hypothetical protein
VLSCARCEFLGFSSSFLCAASFAPKLPNCKLPGEPHHPLQIDNEFVRAYYLEVAPHDETQLHQHDHDYIYVSLGPADVINNAVCKKPEVHLSLKNGETRFTHGGFAHVAGNLSDAPFRNVTIELLKASGEPRNLCAQIVPNLAGVGGDKTTGTARGGHGFSVETQLEADPMRLEQILKRETLNTLTHSQRFFCVDSDKQGFRCILGGEVLLADEFSWTD